MSTPPTAPSPTTSPRSPFGRLRGWWSGFAERRPGLAQFLLFFVLSNGVTVLQLALMPAFKAV
ncbi:hypothetical protein ABIC85_003387, partial [Oerskovia enterophila]